MTRRLPFGRLRSFAVTALTAGLAAASTVSLPSTAPALAAAPATVDGVRLNGYEARLVADINAVRARVGLRRLVVAAGTTDVARGWAWQLGRQQGLSHNPALVARVAAAGSANWGMVSENVGYSSAYAPDDLYRAYMNSPPHRENILDPQARYVGVGVVERSMGGALYAFNTLDFVDRYSSTYGHTRQPAAGMHYDKTAITSTVDLATFEYGFDQRFRTVSAGGLRISAPVVDRPSTGDNALRYRVRAISTRNGVADLVLRQGLDLRNATRVLLHVGVSDAAARSLRAAVYLSTPWVGAVRLGAITVPARAGWVALTVPTAARGFRGELLLRVPADQVATLSSTLSGRTALVSLYGVRVAA